MNSVPNTSSIMNLCKNITIKCSSGVEVKTIIQNMCSYYPTTANTVQITVQVYSDIAQLFVQ